MVVSQEETPVEERESLATSLAKIRRLSGSGLAHQSKPAQLLIAIESTLHSTLPSSSSSPAPIGATAYFTALLQCLEKACNDEIPGGQDEDMAESENLGQGALIPATLYLLATVIPETPLKVVLSKLDQLLGCALPLLEPAMEHPPALRSLVQIITSVLSFASTPLLNSSPLLKKAWNWLLEISVDARPKVRHVAQEGMRKVLTTPIPPRQVAGGHPYLPKARSWVMKTLESESTLGGSAKGKKARFADDNDGKKIIWLVQGLRGWVNVWGEEHLSELCDRLLSLPPLPHLTPQIYSLLALLLSPSPHVPQSAQSTFHNLPTILDSLLSSAPDIKSSASDIPTYLSATTSTLIKLSFQDPLSLPSYLQKAINLYFTYLLDGKANKAVTDAVTESLGSGGLVRYCFTDSMILDAINHSTSSSHSGSGKKAKSAILSKLIATLENSITANPLRIGNIFSILTALVSRSRLRVRTDHGQAVVDPEGRGKTAAETLLLPLIANIADLRINPGFGEKEKLDEVLGMSIEVMGVQSILTVLPLNIETDENGNAPQPGRAHLLPLIRSRATNDSLLFFTSYFRPLSERIFGKKVAADEAGREAEVKVWEVIIGQIWDCFPGFCEMPRDLKQGLTTPFLTLLTNLLYTQPLLLSPVIKGLSALVTSTHRLATSASESTDLKKQFGVDQTIAKADLEYLKTLAKDMVSVLLNVFSKLPREQRNPVGDVIGVWVGIMKEQDITATYNTVTTHLSTNLDKASEAGSTTSPIPHTMLDLLIIFSPHLPPSQATSLFKATASDIMLRHADPTVQKKSYRLMKRLIESDKLGKLSGEMSGVVAQLKEAEGGAGPGTQRDRLQLIATIVQHLSDDQLHLIPEFLGEAVLGTKEVNERARDAGFDLIIVMGDRMAKGGTVARTSGPDDEGMDGDAVGGGEVNATVEELVTMVAAGLTGTTPHMISASINALSRLVFEYKDQLSKTTLSELVSTTSVFLASKNREIVKSALGFVKLLTITLEPDIVTPHLHTLVPALLGWVHDHKNHFKQKTVHIFERMIRRFGYDAVYKCAPVGGERKVLEGIKKRKDRAKRKKAEKADKEGEDETPVNKTSSGNAFEDVLYNSDSELDDSDDDDDVPARQAHTAKGRKGDAPGYIRADGDQPMDLLSRSIASGVSRADPSSASRKRKPGQDAAHFATDKSGKMVIEDSDESSDDSDATGEGNAFVSAQRGIDGQVRDSRGGIKFSRNTAKARREENDEDGMDVDRSKAGKMDKVREKRQKRMKARLGDEFRSKRGGGDIKRLGGPDPYSYVSLGQANARKGGQKFNLTNKKKGSRR